MTVTRTRTRDGFPDWEIVPAGERWFDWYDVDTVTELRFDVAGDEWRLAVDDSTRMVIRAGRDVAGDVEPWPNLAAVAGLVRVFHGSDTYGHTDYYVARNETGTDY